MRPYRFLFAIAGLLSCGVGAQASPVNYAVTVNTSSLAGTMGSLDFNFDPGPLGSQAASAQITNITGGVLSGSPVLSGDATSSLPAIFSFDNGTAFNDVFQLYLFGPSLAFDVSLSGPALSAPDGSSLSGSVLAFSLFSDAAGTTPALTSNTLDGFAITFSDNLDGSTTVTNYTTGSVSAIQGTTSVTPEPAGWWLVSTGLLLGLACWKANGKRGALLQTSGLGGAGQRRCPPLPNIKQIGGRAFHP